MLFKCKNEYLLDTENIFILIYLLTKIISLIGIYFFISKK